MNRQQTICPSVSGNLEAVEQGLTLFAAICQTDYTYKATPYVESCMGEHLRHIVDMYLALINAGNTGIVDYNCRRRGALIEQELPVGILELQEIRKWLLNLEHNSLDQKVTILSETSVSSQQICEMPSTLRRELLFVASHTIHHFALIRVVAKHLDLEVSEQLGYAPATATYLRGHA